MVLLLTFHLLRARRHLTIVPTVHQHVSGQIVWHKLVPQPSKARTVLGERGGREAPALIRYPGSELRPLQEGEYNERDGEKKQLKTMSLFTSAHSQVSGATQVPLL